MDKVIKLQTLLGKSLEEFEQEINSGKISQGIIVYEHDEDGICFRTFGNDIDAIRFLGTLELIKLDLINSIEEDDYEDD